MMLQALDARPAVLAGAAALLLTTWLVVSTIRQYVRLRHIKGPPMAGLTQAWLIRCVGSGRTHLDLWEVCQKTAPHSYMHLPFRDVARVGPNDLITSDPELMKRMLNVRTHYKRSAWYDAMRLDPTKDNVLSQRNDELHASTRSKMAAGYSGKEVDDLEPRIDARATDGKAHCEN
ncbi:hypothetical protein B0J13DRAFT_681726 [Dactylonectria estremocensis]|uniref:Uncharacterized protein n=1 Tax=Dactylonectria estremocensis TaxID=1079267 RepID=A0A9P9IA13_9HYPO|nr:hypothetical protein B0J13DRAFT_681726 [Dactylonectria estremocensis]